MATRTEETVRCAVGVERRGAGQGTDVHWRHVAFHHESPRHGVALDTKPHDRARHAKACHSMVWLYTSSLARYSGNNSKAEQGRRGAHENWPRIHSGEGVKVVGPAQVCNRSAVCVA